MSNTCVWKATPLPECRSSQLVSSAGNRTISGRAPVKLKVNLKTSKESRKKTKREHPYQTTSTRKVLYPLKGRGCRATGQGVRADKAYRLGTPWGRDIPTPFVLLRPLHRRPGWRCDGEPEWNLFGRLTFGVYVGGGGGQFRGHQPLSGGKHLNASSCLRGGDSLTVTGRFSRHLEPNSERRCLKVRHLHRTSEAHLAVGQVVHPQSDKRAW